MLSLVLLRLIFYMISFPLGYLPKITLDAAKYYFSNRTVKEWSVLNQETVACDTLSGASDAPGICKHIVMQAYFSRHRP